MISPKQILNHIRVYLPFFTDIFSETMTASAVGVGGTTVQVTALNHGFAPGNQFIISFGRFQNPIISIVDNGDGTARFQTEFDHDLTEPKKYLDPVSLKLANFNEPEWNGEFEIVCVPNRRFFEVSFPDGINTLPTGAGYLDEYRSAGIVGVQTVSSVIDTDNFTFEAENVPNFPIAPINELKLLRAIHVYGAAEVERAEKAYAKLQSSNVASPAVYVIMDNVTVSKDRHTLNDGVASFNRSNIGKQTLINEFMTIVFFPTNNNTTAFNVQNEAYTTVYKALASSLYGFAFDDPETAMRYVCVNDGHETGVYNGAYYTHIYHWQVPTVVVFENNGWGLQPDVAWRDINSKWRIDKEIEDHFLLNVNLDEEPLP